MASSYGKTIRKVRLNAGFSQKEVYTEIVSKSFAIAFEKGEYSIKIESFLEILERLMLSFDEFMYIHQGYQTKKIEDLGNRINLASNQNNEALLKKYYDEAKNSRSMKTRVLAEQAHVLSYVIHYRNQPEENKIYPQESVQFLKTFLLRSDEWTFRELTIFNNVSDIFDEQTEEMLTIYALKTIDRYQNYVRLQDELFLISLSILGTTIEKGRLKQAKEQIKNLAAKPYDTFQMLHRTLLLFYKGTVSYLEGDQEKGIYLLSQAFLMLKLDHQEVLKRQFYQVLEKHSTVNVKEIVSQVNRCLAYLEITND
ncbi:Rgg/GadR/MutR family transcriptional regulator [Isobaculum melis]|uniref:Transcriptional activator, Rgg/GadR/MutR family, C-terminal domain-containing protein n=1 Tax=Isobaculum melis TaxID=142588 RepID=A0A1H9U840_9LACT|nr:Rgg/GadR/MutR family transcriptional regulator [Isobaculum melis]SES05408.1 transcriptional activator, Rgg/GadR/MutR family, C-terminal domain-containing protein [Isobaculum melis]